MNKKNIFSFLTFLFLSLLFTTTYAAVRFGGSEFTGQFSPELVANTEDFEKIVFKSAPSAAFKGTEGIGEKSHISIGRLYNPQTGEYTVTAILVENKKDDPFIYVDLDDDGSFTPNEKIKLQQELEDNPYLWNATVNLPVKSKTFSAAPIFVRYFKEIQIAKMGPDDRLVTQSTDVLASGNVDVKGKKVLVQYAYDFESQKIDPQNGWLGVDTNGDGKVDMDSLSYEAAKAAKEAVVFRAGEMYLSTVSADVSKNRIVMREHDAKEYKRIELEIGKELPDFEFTDLDGKKHQFSEFRGKYVIVDFWGLWCPACLEEAPYLRESYNRFKSRNLEILGMNTDPNPPLQIKEVLNKAQMKWTQAKLESIYDLINARFRIESFPTTFLVSPEGKLLSMSRNDKDELDLRGEDLLTTLDKVLPR